MPLDVAKRYVTYEVGEGRVIPVRFRNHNGYWTAGVTLDSGEGIEGYLVHLDTFRGRRRAFIYNPKYDVFFVLYTMEKNAVIQLDHVWDSGKGRGRWVLVIYHGARGSTNVGGNIINANYADVTIFFDPTPTLKKIPREDILEAVIESTKEEVEFDDNEQKRIK